MEHSREKVLRNLAQYAEPARMQMALTVNDVGRLTGLTAKAVTGIERGDADAGCTLDELIGVALFLGLTIDGTPRPKPPGSTA